MTSPASSSDVKTDTSDILLLRRVMAMPVEEVINGNTFLLVSSDFTETERIEVENFIVSMGGKVTSSYSDKYCMKISSDQYYPPSSHIIHIKVANFLEAKMKKKILVY